MVAKYGGWLKVRPNRGWCCIVCIDSTCARCLRLAASCCPLGCSRLAIRVLARALSLKAQDKLSTTGYGYVMAEGQSPVLAPIPAEQKLKEHETREHHRLNMQKAGTSKALSKQPVYQSITFEDELLARTVRTVHLIVVRQLSLNDMYHLLELENANGAIVSFDHSNDRGDVRSGGVLTWLEAGASVFSSQNRERAANPLMQVLFPRGIPFGGMGDGSTDRSLAEQEAVVTRFLGADGKPFNCFHDLAELDLNTSHDKRSPDAQCITACYSTSFDELSSHKGFLHKSDWKAAAVGFSFDGASVMLGTQNGVATRLIGMCECSAIAVHGVAHVEQLTMGDAYKEVDFYEVWKETTQEIYVHYHGSGKKRHGLETIAKELDEDLLKIGGTHGIRWAASQARTIKAVSVDLPSIAADLEETAKSQLGVDYSLMTPSNNFINKTFNQKFEGYRNAFKARVKSFEASADGISTNDNFKLIYSDRTTMGMSKAELVAALTSDDDLDRLEGNSCWKLRSKVISWRFVSFTYFMLDVHEQLTILSKSFQSNSLVVFDIGKNVNKTLRALQKLLETPGKNEKEFLIEVKKDEGADILRTCQLKDGEEGRAMFKIDRKQVLESLNDHLIERYHKVLDNDVLKSLSAFDHRYYPSKSSSAEGVEDEKIEVLYKAFATFFDESETLETLLEQWNEMQQLIISTPGLMLRPYVDLWSHMLIHFHEDYPLPLRLVVIGLLIPADTSECERIFSLMNDIKTAERSRMKTRTLRNLMMWHRMARRVEESGQLSSKHLACREVPVMEIVQAFRELAGEFGRRPHRAFPVPSYEYEKGRTQEAKEAMAKALSGQVPVTTKDKAAPVNEQLPTKEMGPLDGEPLDGEVDSATAGGHFARWGESQTPHRGLHAGEYLGIRRVTGGAGGSS